MKMIVGLGNPGKQYEKTYHNIGFIVMDALNKYLGGKWKKKENSIVSEVFFAGQKILLVKPQTFMNLSGEAVLKLTNKFKIDLQDALIVLDDIDLPVGTLRFKQSGSGGTHNGLKNILLLLKTNDVPRLRIGISKNENMDLADFVLSKITKQDNVILQEAVLKSVDFIVSEILV
jgi:PTH1 family peptidyl-tRNA hydrolase